MRNKPNRGSQGYNRIVDIVDGKPCTKLKRHYRDCPREVIGYLETLAENDPERFVFASVPDIVKHCKNRKKDNQPYGRRACEYSIALVQKDLVLSQQVRRFRRGAWRMGWLVAHHATVAVCDGRQCDFKGQRHWEREIKTVRQPDGNWKVSSIGPVRWTEWETGAAVKCTSIASSDAPALHQHALDSREEMDGVRCAVRSSVRSTDAKCAARCAVPELAKSPQPIEKENTSSGDGCANRISRSQSALGTLQTHQLTTSAIDSSQGKLQDETNSKSSIGVGVENKRLSDYSKTIGQHFGTEPMWPARVNIETMAAGQMMLDVWYEKVDEDVQHDLLSCCNEVIADMAAEPYRGLATNGMIMDLAAQRFRKKFGRFPKCWLKVLNDLKRAGNTSL